MPAKQIGWLLLLAVAGCAQGRLPGFSGAVTRGREFRKEMGGGLVFVLSPSDTGWVIGVAPQTRCGEDNGDWASVVNAPYRNYNALHVDSSYGITAQEAVGMGARAFSFVATCEDYKNEARRLGIVLWPYNHPRADVDDAMAKLATSRLGKGKLTILHSNVTRAEKDIEGKNYGRIDSLKFRLDLVWPGR